MYGVDVPLKHFWNLMGKKLKYINHRDMSLTLIKSYIDRFHRWWTKKYKITQYLSFNENTNKNVYNYLQ